MPIIPEYAYLKVCLCGRVGTIVLPSGEEINCIYSKEEAISQVAQLLDAGEISELESRLLFREIDESVLVDTEDDLSPKELLDFEACSTFPETQEACRAGTNEEMLVPEYVM